MSTSANKNNSGRARSLPMIVDVAVDPHGKTLYHVHESGQLVQQATPLSSNYNDSSRFLFDPPEELKSPMGTASSTHLPCSEKAKPAEEVSKRKGSDPKLTRSSTSSTDDIWPSDVESAFEEALLIVPKCGLNKIKIAGKLCGRNELIADFILARTGKFRSRKQVSSHIQVVKNMKLKGHLITLINDGPEFKTPEEAEENMKRFEEVFSKININKSLGLNFTGESELSGSGGLLRRHSTEQLTLPPKRRKLPVLIINVKNINFTIDSDVDGGSPVTLTRQRETPMKFLSIKENANIASRFPGLEEFSNTHVPLIHNMVNILSPLKLATTQSIEAGLRTNFNIELPGPCENLSSFTTVYSFGDEVLKVNEENFQIDSDQPFLLKFWKCFFHQILHLPTSLDAAFKGVTVKQVIYDNSEPVTTILPKSKIRAVLLWEFAKVEEFSEAVSSSSRLFLPPTLGYSTMTANNSNYSIRPPQPTYTLSQSSIETMGHQMGYLPASSTTSLHNMVPALEYDLHDTTRSQENIGYSQLSYPGYPPASAILDQRLASHFDGPTFTHTSLTQTPLSTIFDGDSARLFSPDEQNVTETTFR